MLQETNTVQVKLVRGMLDDVETRLTDRAHSDQVYAQTSANLGRITELLEKVYRRLTDTPLR